MSNLTTQEIEEAWSGWKYVVTDVDDNLVLDAVKEVLADFTELKDLYERLSEDFDSLLVDNKDLEVQIWNKYDEGFEDGRERGRDDALDDIRRSL